MMTSHLWLRGKIRQSGMDRNEYHYEERDKPVIRGVPMADGYELALLGIDMAVVQQTSEPGKHEVGEINRHS